MSDTLKKKFIASLEIDTKTAEQQIKGTSQKIINQINNIGKASDKMTYFKPLVEDLSNIEDSLHDFESKFGKNMLDEILGHISPQIETELKKVLGITKDQLAEVEKLYSSFSEMLLVGLFCSKYTKNEKIALREGVQTLHRWLAHIYQSIQRKEKNDSTTFPIRSSKQDTPFCGGNRKEDNNSCTIQKDT